MTSAAMQDGETRPLTDPPSPLPTPPSAWEEALAAHAAVLAEHERVAAYIAACADSGYLVARRSWLVSVALWHGMDDSGLTTGDALVTAAGAYCQEHDIRLQVYRDADTGPGARWRDAELSPLPREDFATGLALRVDLITPGCGRVLDFVTWSPADLGEQLARHVAGCAACRERRPT